MLSLWYSYTLLETLLYYLIAVTLPTSYSVLLANPYEKGGLITLYYDFNQTNQSVTLGIVATNPPFGYIGLGFGRDDMFGTDMVIAMVNGSHVTLDDYWSIKHGKPALDSSIEGCKSSYYLLDSLVNSTHWIYTFGRSMQPDDACDFSLTQNASMYLAYAWKNVSKVGFHGTNYGQVRVNFTQGYKGYALPPKGSNGIGKIIYYDCYFILISLLANEKIILPSSYQTLKDDTITLYFDFDYSTENATVTLAIVLTEPPFGWIGIGFGSSTMTDTDMLIAQLINGQVGIDDYFSSRQGRPAPDQNYPGGKSDWEFVDFSLNENIWVVKVKRLVNTGDKYDFALYPNESLPICVAWGNKLLSFHDSNYLQLNINFTQGAKGGASENFNPMDVHAWLLLMSWGFLIDIGLIAARYMKGSNRYLIVHAVFAAGTVGATLGAIIEMLVFGNSSLLVLK